MPRRSRGFIPKHEPNPDSLRTIRPNGEAPESRIRTASQAHLICTTLIDAGTKLAKKRERLYKAYKRFPPTDYSSIIELKMEGQSNVNWGLMAFIINNTMTSFYDMVSERGTACDIQTKHGNPLERRIWSELISVAYDVFGLREDFNYLIGVEEDLLDMALYGKGIQMYDSNEGFQSEHCPARDFYVPDDTRISLDNFDLFMRKRKYQLHELFQRIENRDQAIEMGWNVDAVITAMRVQRDDWRKYRDNEEFLHEVTRGKTSLTSVIKEKVHVYDLYVREFEEDKISRFMVLQDFTPVMSLVNEKVKQGSADDDTVMDSEGFLFSKVKYAENVRRVVSVFIDRAGSGEWHDTPSLAEEVYVQCRQYDITMNSIMDAIKLNMTLMLQGSTAEATERLKAMIWGQFAVIPADTPFVQQRMQMDTSNATETLQYMMSDLYSGIGHYRVQQTAPSGDSPTATQRQLDAAESAKLSGTQVKRYNEQQTIHHVEKFRRFVSLKDGEKGYEHFKKFKEEMKDMGVPEKAWKHENIRTLRSNMIAGPGSPSYKLMAAERIIAFTNITPKDDGQRAAVEDGIAALAGRENVRRYLPPKQRVDPTWEERLIGLECESFSDPMLNPRNVAAFPSDDHIKHIDRHMNDMAQTIEKINGAIQAKAIKEDVAMPAITRLLHEGAHVGAHMKFLALDKDKVPMLKQFAADLNILQKQVEKIQQNLAQLLDEKKSEAGFEAAHDPDIQKKMALAQIEIDTAQKIAAIKLSGMAQAHETRDEITKDKASTSIAVERAKAAAAARQPKPKPPIAK